MAATATSARDAVDVEIDMASDDGVVADDVQMSDDADGLRRDDGQMSDDEEALCSPQPPPPRAQPAGRRSTGALQGGRGGWRRGCACARSTWCCSLWREPRSISPPVRRATRPPGREPPLSSAGPRAAQSGARWRRRPPAMLRRHERGRQPEAMHDLAADAARAVI